MTGRGKRATATESVGADSEQPSASKQQKTASMAGWCADCWGMAQGACHSGHRLLDREAAQKDAQAEFAAANREVVQLQQRVAAQMKAAKEKVARLQQRLDALTDARIRDGPVVEASVDEEEEGKWYFPGGEIRIGIAATESLTAEDKEGIRQALEGLDIDYETDETDSLLACGYGVVDVHHLVGVMAKLADCVEDQVVRQGAVLLTGGGVRFEVRFMDSAPLKDEDAQGAKVFGFVQSGLDALEGEGCGGDRCKDIDMTCFCKTGVPDPTTTTLRNAKIFD